ncbi:MAG TPA: hypothetical protein VFH73_14385 [Polyangia bacterium]|nr:hypothetical protein [Polyangia bacterium]
MCLRAVAFSALCLIVPLGVNCGGGAQSPGDGGGPGATGSGGTSPAGAGGAVPGTGGTAGTGPTGGNPGGTGGQAGVDNGKLFTDAATVPPDAGNGTTPDTTTPAGDSVPSGIPGDGNMATAQIGSLGLKAVFTQKGTDVTVVITATRCSAGNHTFEVHEGFACDDPTKGPVWGMGKRGTGLSPLVCGADQKGTLTYTRTAADPALKWTVADHNKDTDVTLHPIMVETNCGTFF